MNPRTMAGRRPARAGARFSPQPASGAATGLQVKDDSRFLDLYYQAMFWMTRTWLVFLLLIPTVQAQQPLESLSGQWRFALDRSDVGIGEGWFRQKLAGALELPGSLPAQGIGDDIKVDTRWTGGIVDQSFFVAPEYARYREPGHVKVPFWLQPEKYYSGVAWYQRDIDFDKAWDGQRLTLFLERPHWETRVWLDGALLGTNQSLSTPHEYDLGLLASGMHQLTVRVDNRLVVDVGQDSHSVSDHTQGNWNGIVGRIELRSTPPVWMHNLEIYPHLGTRSLTVRGRIDHRAAESGQSTIRLRVFKVTEANRVGVAALAQTNFVAGWGPGGAAFQQEVELPSVEAWDEFDPALYELECTLNTAPGQPQQTETRFGFREFQTDGTQFKVNGRKIFLRGTLECCIFPKTGHPPTDKESWRRVIQVAKAYGLNNLRFHSWCPPEAAFQAADELGLYCHVECASWANASTTLGDGKPVDAWIYEEADRILQYYGNHPSFVLMLYGNEPGGNHHQEFLSRWVNHYKTADPRRLYSSGAGWPQLAENQFHITPDPRIQSWGSGLKSRINAAPPETITDYRQYIADRHVPVVSHEIGQWCVYPNFEEMTKYTGYLKPRNFEVFQDTMRAHGLASQAKAFLFASGKLQVLCYKEEIESALRTPGMAGFQLLDLHDFPGQGSALVGVLDPFWEEKGYVTAAEYHRFCGATVPLARLNQRVFTQNQTSFIPIDIAHFGPKRLEKVWPVFKVVDASGRMCFQEHGAACDIETGNLQRLTEFELDSRRLPAPAACKIVGGLARQQDGRGLICENDWDIWVYPSAVEVGIPQGITVVRDLNQTAQATLQAGGSVLWFIAPNQVAPDKKLGRVELGFSSIFWNTAWTKRQAPHTLGILCDSKHPLFAEFPTDDHSNWQWWYLVSQAGALILDELPSELRPTVQVIDDWFTARKLGLVVEVRVGSGKLLVCSIDLEANLGNNPVARQFRHSLLDYMQSERFQPKVQTDVETLRTLKRVEQKS